MDNKIPIVVFDMTTPGNIMKVLQGENIGPGWRFLISLQALLITIINRVLFAGTFFITISKGG